MANDLWQEILKFAEEEKSAQQAQLVAQQLDSQQFWGELQGKLQGELVDGTHSYTLGTVAPSGGETLTLIKKSIRQISVEAVGEEAQARVKAKIERLEKLGAVAQAESLRTDLRVRQKLMALTEWDYKVLPYDAVKAYNHSIVNSYTMIVHIDPLERFSAGIMPDAVLDELEKAKERQVFDSFAVLSVEKKPDPLLLGQIDGCKDYFLIAEWGEDVSFDDLVKNVGSQRQI